MRFVGSYYIGIRLLVSATRPATSDGQISILDGRKLLSSVHWRNSASRSANGPYKLITDINCMLKLGPSTCCHRKQDSLPNYNKYECKKKKKEKKKEEEEEENEEKN